jgi:hypothetical protein
MAKKEKMSFIENRDNYMATARIQTLNLVYSLLPV